MGGVLVGITKGPTVADDVTLQGAYFREVFFSLAPFTHTIAACYLHASSEGRFFIDVIDTTGPPVAITDANDIVYREWSIVY